MLPEPSIDRLLAAFRSVPSQKPYIPAPGGERISAAWAQLAPALAEFIDAFRVHPSFGYMAARAELVDIVRHMPVAVAPPLRPGGGVPTFPPVPPEMLEQLRRDVDDLFRDGGK